METVLCAAVGTACHQHGLETCTVYGECTVRSCRHSKSSTRVRSMYYVYRPYCVQLQAQQVNCRSQKPVPCIVDLGQSQKTNLSKLVCSNLVAKNILVSHWTRLIQSVAAQTVPNCTWCCTSLNKMLKQSHYRHGQAQRVLRKLRFPDFVTTAQNSGRLSALRTGRL